MSYSDIIKIRAYALFIQGVSYDETARKLSAEFPQKVSPSTVRKWAEAKDIRGYSWNDYRNDTRVEARHTIEIREKSRLVAIRDKAEILSEKLFKNLTDEAAPKLSSADGGTYAFKAISEFLLKVDEKAGQQIDVIAVIQSVLEIFAAVPSVRDAIQANWGEIEKEIRLRILHENPNEDVKQIEELSKT